MMKKYIALISAALLFGCAQPLVKYDQWTLIDGGVITNQYYEGETKELKDVGVILTDSIVYITSVDGANPYLKHENVNRLMGKRHIQNHLQPGTHLVKFCFYYSDGNSWGKCTTEMSKVITLNAGQIYMANYVAKSRNTWTVELSDGSAYKDAAEKDFKKSMTNKD